MNQSSSENTETVTDSEINTAIKKSLEVHKEKKRKEEIHQQRLERLISANNLVQIPVPRDGNCFFSSIAILSGDTMEVVRDKVCTHMLANKAEYTQYMPENISFINEVWKFKKSGIWNNDVGDCLPYAISQIYKKKIVIYTSDSWRPVIKLTSPVASAVWNLGYIAIKGHEHYEPLIEPANIIDKHVESTESDGCLNNMNTDNVTTSDIPGEGITHSDRCN